MSTRFSFHSIVMFIFAGAALTACAGTKGAPYPDYAAELKPVAQNEVRIMLLRPNDRYDDYRGSPATLRVNGVHVGDLHYGNFLAVEATAGTVDLWTSAQNRFRSPFIKSCEMQLATMPGTTIYVDVAPRNASIVAGLIGAVAGSVAGPASGVYGVDEVGKALVVDPMVAGAVSSAGSATAQAIESSGKTCGGHFGLKLLDEQEALVRLEKMHLAQ